MSKAHRGKGIRDQVAHGRGECPVCNRRNVKIIYEQEAGDQKVKVCKTCRAAIKHGKKSVVHIVGAVKAEAAHPVASASANASASADAPAAEPVSAAETPASEAAAG